MYYLPTSATEIPRGGGGGGGGGGESKSRQFQRGWGWPLEVFFPGTQVTLGSCCCSAVAYRLLLAKKDLYRAKLKILDHELT